MVKPYRFENIPKLNKAELEFRRGISHFISQKPFEPHFLDALEKVLVDYLKIDCKVSPPEIKLVAQTELEKLLPKTSTFVILGAAPSTEKIVVEIDAAFLSFTLERLLGGSGNEGRILKAFTEFEEGVLSFLILKLLKIFQQGFKSGFEMALSLDRLLTTYDDIKPYVEKSDKFHWFGSRIAYGDSVGYARILLPASLIQILEAKAPQQSGTVEEGQLRKNLAAMGTASIEARVIAASFVLGTQELQSLEPGDIVILERHQLTKAEVGVEGEVLVRLGAGKNGGLLGQLQVHEDHYRLQITEIMIQEQPL